MSYSRNPDIRYVNLLSSPCQHTVILLSTIYSILNSILIRKLYSELLHQTFGLKKSKGLIFQAIWGYVIKSLSNKTTKIKISTPIKTIRKMCLDCTSGSYKSIRFCLQVKCPLWCYRMGKRPDSVTRSTYSEFAGKTTHLPDDFYPRNGNDE